MKKYLQLDPWKIIENEFHPELQRSSESLFSLGNGYMGQRANFEEQFSGSSLLGNYIAGVYYPDPTKVGWWKNGYPEYYARIVNITNWIGIDIKINGETLDLNSCKLSEFTRTLHLDKGYLERSFIAKLANGNQIKVHAIRFLSMAHKEIGVIKYAVTALNFSGKIIVTPYLDSDVKNESSNWNELFLDEKNNSVFANEAYANTITRRSNYHITTGFKTLITKNDQAISYEPKLIQQPQYVANEIELDIATNDTVTIYKFAANVNSRDHEIAKVPEVCKEVLTAAVAKGFETLFAEQQQYWVDFWQQHDITIEGDPEAQQAIRFNLYQLTQSFTGEDARLNVGPKGFTGEKYGATTQWDSEAYCLPYYLSTTNNDISKNLLLYRYNHLQAAIDNATNIGFTDGAALYPMATVDGKEGQNEWEITFEEIHRNGAIAYAIYNYVNYTDDKSYLVDHGLEVLIGISRFWSQRVSFSKEKNQYVMLGVTGPNEYENNINNNWYTNMLACWTMQYTIDVIKEIKNTTPNRYQALSNNLNFKADEELKRWHDIIENMYFPIDNKTGVFLQQEGYLDKEQIMVKDLDPAQRPINQHWSWDRILRSCFIKQADVLQGLFFFPDKYDKKTLKNNFDFYEPRTVHESSLSPCIHAALAARIGYLDKAYEMFMRTARLDLDDYNSEAAEGCHITSMAGTWLSLVYGYAGFWVKNDKVHLDPVIMPKWQAYSFNVWFRDCLLSIKVTQDSIAVTSNSNINVTVVIDNKEHILNQDKPINLSK